MIPDDRERKILGVMRLSTIPIKLVQSNDSMQVYCGNRLIGVVNHFMFEQLEPVEILELLKITARTS